MNQTNFKQYHKYLIQQPTLMKVNESYDKNSSSQELSYPFFSEISKKTPSQQQLSSHKDEPTRSPIHFNNPYRNVQILLSILIVLLSTLWVQIAMQHNAPFIRSAQCYFNQLVLQHTSQDIYEGSDVVYYRTGQYYLFADIIGLYSRLNSIISSLQTNSMFNLRPSQFGEQQQADVELLVRYYYPQIDIIDSVFIFNSTLADLESFLNSTLLNRTFYQFLWETELSIHIPILYRDDPSILQVEVTSQLYSSFLLQFSLDVNLLDSTFKSIKSQNGQQFNESQLGIRKRNNPVDIQLNAPFLEWIVLALYLIVFTLEFTFLFRKNQEVNHNLRLKIIEEKRIEKLIHDFNTNDLQNAEILKVNDSSNESKQDDKIDTSNKNFKIPKKYQIEMKERISKIGAYHLVELILSLLALLGSYNDHSGIVCLFAWMKLVAYLSQTKNKLMIGFLFEDALPLYSKIFFNIIILITAFVMFDMLVYSTTRKFETVELSYFQYFFNYFQYGIYQNFILGLQVHGMLAQFFYFLQLMILLYVGNNILMSILAGQVLKHSYLKSVEQMIDEIKISCPACGADFHQQKKLHHFVTDRNRSQHHSLMSKFISDYDLQSRRKGSIDQSSDYNIIVTSPLLSPFFPAKNQKEKKEQKFVSPKLKGGEFERQMKEINSRATEQQKVRSSKVEELNKLSNKYHNKKRPKIEISESRLSSANPEQGKFHQQIRSKIELLFQKIEKFNQIQKQVSKKTGYHTPLAKYNQIRTQILSELLIRVDQFRKDCENSIDIVCL